MKFRRPNRGVAALLLGFVLLLGLPYFITGFLLTGDLRDTYLPLEDFFRDELRAGRLPTWDPRAALGFPVLASAQIGFWYPPLFVLRVLPPEPAFAIATIAHLAALAVGVFLYSKKLGTSRHGALLSALAFTGSGFILGHLTHSNILFGIAWLPWALILTERLAKTLRPKTAVLLSIVISLAALAGHFHVAAMILIFCAFRFFALHRTLFRGTPLSHTLWTGALLFGPIALGIVLLTAAQLFPTLELLRESSRGSGGGFDVERANQHSFPPWHLVTFLVPAFYGFPDFSEYWGTRPQIEMTAWIGSLPLLLAIVGVFSRGRGTRFWILTGLAGFLLALGRWSPFRLIGFEPTLGIFSAPARYLLFSQFALAILAGQGYDQLTEQRTERKPPRKVAGLFGALSALVFGASFLLLLLKPDVVRTLGRAAVENLIRGKPGHVLSSDIYQEKVEYLLDRLRTWGVNVKNPSVLLSVSLLGVGGIMLLRRRSTARSRILLPIAVLILTASELILIAWQMYPKVAWADTTQTPPTISALEHREPGRLYVVRPPGDTGLLFANPRTKNRDEHEFLLRDLATANIFTRYGISGVEWPAALDLSTASTVVGAMRDEQGRPVDENLLDRLGIQYVAGSSTTPNLILPPPAREILAFPSGENATIRVWERPTARARVELFEELPRDIHESLPPSIGSARIAAEHPQRIDIAVENPASRDAALILRDTFYRNWEATRDGNTVPIEPADTLFRGVTIPPGTHAVTFRYRPRAAYIGAALSAAAWLGALVVLRRPRKTPTGTP